MKTTIRPFIVLVFLCCTGVSLSQDDVAISLAEVEFKLNELKGEKRLEYYYDLFEKGDMQSALTINKLAMSAYKESMELGSTIYQVRFLKHIGSVKHKLSQYDSTEIYLSRGLDLADRYGFHDELVELRLEMSILYVYRGQFEQGIKNLKQLIISMNLKSNSLHLGIAFNRIGAFYLEIQQKDSAKYFLKKADSLLSTLDEFKWTVNSNANLGFIYFMSNDFVSAEKHFKKALAISKQKKFNFGMIFSNLHLAKIRLIQKDYVEAQKLAEIALDYAVKEKSVDFVSKCFQALGDLKFQQGDYKGALDYSQKSGEIKDSLNSLLNQQQMSEALAMFQVYEAEQEAINLKSRLDHESYQRTIWFSVTLFIFSVASILGVMWFKIRKKNRFLFEQSLKTAIGKKQPMSFEQSPSEISKYKDLFNLIEKEMLENKIYLDPNLSINTLSTKVKSNSNYTSKAINQFYGGNFNSYVNNHRVNESKNLIIDGFLDTFTVKTLSEKCGFSSLSAFLRAFKKETGITPTFFKKSLV